MAGTLRSPDVLTAIDHVILGVQDQDGAAVELERELGLAASDGGRHEAHGTHNRLLWLGDSYVELLGAFDAALARRSWWGRHALEVNAAGGGFIGMALASDRIESDGASVGSIEHGQRARPDSEVVRWRLAHSGGPLPDLGLAFLIEHDTPAPSGGLRTARRGRAQSTRSARPRG